MEQHLYPLTPEEKNMAVLAHVLAFSTFLVPLGSILGPLILWLIKKDDSEYIHFHGKESLNFQISCFIYAVISGALVMVLIGILMLIALGIFWLVLVIMAAVKASNGEYFHYPLSIPFIK